MSVKAVAMSSELVFLTIASGGFLIGKLFHKIKLPDITGQILLGLLLGPSGALLFSFLLGHKVEPLISEDALHALSFLSQIALGVMTFSIGSYLTRHSLHNAGQRIIRLSVAHTFITSLVVFLGLFFIAKTPAPPALLLSAIAIAAAPGTIISIVQKKNSRGVFTKTLLGVVALSNFSTIVIYDIAHPLAKALASDEVFSLGMLLTSLVKPAITVMWGIGAGFLAAKGTQHLHDKRDITTILALMIIANIAGGMYLGFSPLLINLIMGAVFSNFSYHTKTMLTFFGDLEHILFSLFFTLAGTHLDVRYLPAAGLAGAVFIIGRLVAQSASAVMITKAFKYNSVIGKYLGLAMLPKAGLAIGLLIAIADEAAFTPYISLVTAVVLAAVVVNEMIGPFAVSKSLDWAHETDQATPRLIDFLHEEFIMKPVVAEDKWEVIDIMSEFLIRANHLKHISKEELHRIVVERENEFPTAIGEQLAVPHARIPGNHKLMGVIGICEKPVEFGAFDKKPVDIVILVATPEGKNDLHVKLLATIARIFSNQEFHKKIVAAESTAEVYDLLQSSDIRNINTYIDEE